MGIWSATQGKKDTDAPSLFTAPIEFLHTEHSHWLLKQRTERALKGHHLILLTPCRANLNSLEAPVNSIWAQSWVQILQVKEDAENSNPSQWFFLYIFPVEFICLKVSSQWFWAWTPIVSQYVVFFFFFLPFKHTSNLMCYCNIIYPQVFQKPVWWMILI